MLSTFTRRIARLESLRKKTEPKSPEDFLQEVEDYAWRTGLTLVGCIWQAYRRADRGGTRTSCRRAGAGGGRNST
jgi:hypothetical protein